MGGSFTRIGIRGTVVVAFWVAFTVGFAQWGSDPVADDCGAVSGTWNWVGGQRLVLHPDRTLTVYHGGSQINSGTYECVDAGSRRYVFRHRNGGWVDTVTLSADGNRLDGANQHGNRLHGTRVVTSPAPPVDCGAVVGTWNWVGGQRLVLHPDRTLSVYQGGSQINSGIWECADANRRRYVFRHRNGGWVDSVTLSADGNTLSGTNQHGYNLHGTRAR